jgi:DMSO/TMAO reductase YedYZ molybdopterin-dependent catalytic subunit
MSSLEKPVGQAGEPLPETPSADSATTSGDSNSDALPDEKSTSETTTLDQSVQPGEETASNAVVPDQSAQRDGEVAPPYSLLRTLLLSALYSLGAGVFASIVAIVCMGILRLQAGIPTPPELLGDYVLKHIDTGTFIRLLATFAPNSKTAPLGLALLGMFGIGSVLGWLYAALVRLRLPVDSYRPARREWLVALALSIVMTLVAVVWFWDEIRQNFFGLTVEWSRTVTSLGLLVEFTLYGIVLCLAYRALLPKQPRPEVSTAAQGRRQILSRAGVAALSVGGAGAALDLIKTYLGDNASYDGMRSPRNGPTPAITTNDQHYVVTQNPIDPTVNTNLWRLEVGGLVNSAGSYTLEEVQLLPSTSRAITLECIANGPNIGLMSTAIWQGVTLKTLLDRHGGPKPEARYVAFYSVDGYNVSLPLNEVLAADALLAWRMNGVELPQRHGYPMRVLIPGRYGEENPKWLTRVELTDHFVGGLYSDQGWYNGPLHTTSRIDSPLPGERIALGRPFNMAGLAFAGNRGIQKVEVSTDGGQNWHVATLQPPLSQDTWVLWNWQWTPLLPGTYTLTVRATDGIGELQTSHKQGTVPNGATGYHEIQVQVG